MNEKTQHFLLQSLTGILIILILYFYTCSMSVDWQIGKCIENGNNPVS